MLKIESVPSADFLTELYEKKFQGKLLDSEFRIQSKALSCEMEELLQFLSDVTVQKIHHKQKDFSLSQKY